MPSLCDICKKGTAVKFWHTGHHLCQKCYDEWNKKDKEIREKEYNEIKNKDVDLFNFIKE